MEAKPDPNHRRAFEHEQKQIKQLLLFATAPLSASAPATSVKRTADILSGELRRTFQEKLEHNWPGAQFPLWAALVLSVLTFARRPHSARLGLAPLSAG